MGRVAIYLYPSSLLLVLLFFVGCGMEPSGSLFQASKANPECEQSDACVEASEDNLSVASAHRIILVRPLQRYINITGYCNDGSYKFNQVSYRVRGDNFSWKDLSAEEYSYCVNGRFHRKLDLQTDLGSDGPLIGLQSGEEKEYLQVSVNVRGRNSANDDWSPASAAITFRLNPSEED